MDADQLSEIAAQLAGRVRDEDPSANGRWLAEALPDPEDWWRLCFVLAAAVPTERTWASLTYWSTVQMSERARDVSRDVSHADSQPTVSHPAQDRVDEIAVERACHGERVKLTRPERALAVDKLTKRGLSRFAIADLLGITERTASRWRAANRSAG